MIPFLESPGGNCQDALILVEELAVRERRIGGFEGAAIEQLHINITLLRKIYIVLLSSMPTCYKVLSKDR